MKPRSGLVVVALAAASILTQVAATPVAGSPMPNTTASPSPCVAPPGGLTSSGGASSGAQTGSGTSTCDQRAALLRQVRLDLGSGLADTMQVQAELTGSLQANAAERDALATRIADTDAKIGALDTEILRLQGEIDTTIRRIDLERAQIAALARTIYAQPDSLFLMLAQSSSFSDALNRTLRLVVAGRRAQDIKVQLGEDLKRLQADQQKAQADRDELAQKRIELQNANEELVSLQDRAMAIGDQLRGVMDEIQAEVAAVDSQSPEVASAVRAQLLADANTIIAEARQVTQDHIRLLLQLAQTNVADLTALGPSEDRFAWPIRNAVLTQGFGPSPYLIEPPFGPYAHFHTGIDLAAPVNSPVLAAANGMVVLVGSDPWGYGNYVVISHGGGMATLYGHLNAIRVAYDERVIQGQVIGLEGSTGRSTGPHLHFEVRVGGVPVDPISYLMPPPA